jgi:hypothetical protein
MRALPLILSLGLMAAVAAAAPVTVPAGTNTAWALVPLARALGATPVSATVEVYATQIALSPPPVADIEKALLPGANWKASTLGQGAVYESARGNETARISELPLPHGRTFLSCSRTEVVSPPKIASSLEHLWGTPCGTDESSVTLTAKLHNHPTATEITQAIRYTGAKPMGVLSGPTGAFALADLPGGRPEVSVGGRSMNLALRISYDRAHHANVLIGAPTLPPGR